MENVAAIQTCSWLYLQEIVEPDENELRIVVVEAKSGAPADESMLGSEEPDVLKEILREARPIVHGSGCRVFEIFWPSYIAYSVRNESYTSLDPYEEKEGRLFVRYTKSRYLDYISNATFATEDYPGPFTHWGLYCLSHIIDVVSMDEPIIKVSFA
jgi:hypothetical protein